MGVEGSLDSPRNYQTPSFQCTPFADECSPDFMIKLLAASEEKQPTSPEENQAVLKQKEVAQDDGCIGFRGGASQVWEGYLPNPYLWHCLYGTLAARETCEDYKCPDDRWAPPEAEQDGCAGTRGGNGIVASTKVANR